MIRLGRVSALLAEALVAVLEKGSRNLGTRPVVTL